MRFHGICYRAHDPRWSFKPMSGEGAAIRGARFNPKGVPALYLALTVMGAVKEMSHGFARRLDPCVLCSYDVDCDDIADLTTKPARRSLGVRLEDMSCAWMSYLTDGTRPPSWGVYDRLAAAGHAGVLAPSFAPGADETDQNLVLWRWGSKSPHKIEVIDPSGRLPRNQLSWN